MQIEINNRMVAYSDRGRGVPLVLVHGFPLNRQMWAPQITGLAESARMIAPDLRGHGDTPPSGDVYSMDLLADDINALLNALDIHTPIHLCGLSMGGYIAFAFYRKYAHRLRSLILTATRAAPDTPEAKAGRDATVQQVLSDGIRPIAEGMAKKLLSSQSHVHNPELISEVREIILRTSIDGTVAALKGMKTRPDSLPTLDQIDLPTLIIHGQDDHIVPVEEAQSMAEKIPGAQLEILPQAGHLPNLEQPERFNKILKQFLQV